MYKYKKGQRYVHLLIIIITIIIILLLVSFSLKWVIASLLKYLLSILADLNSLDSSSDFQLFQSFGTVPNAQTTIGITITLTLMFQFF